MKKEDEVIEELHRIREAIWKEAGGTPQAYARYYYEMSQKCLAEKKAAEETKKSPAKPKAKAAVRRARKPRAKTTVSQ